MFTKLVPVIALALIAGPVLAADPAPATGATPAAKSSSHKGHHHSSSSKSHKTPKSTSTGSGSTAPTK